MTRLRTQIARMDDSNRSRRSSSGAMPRSTGTRMTLRLTYRHTIWLTASVGLAALPHMQRLPWWLTLLVALLFAWRLYIAHARLQLPHRAIIMLVVVAASGGILLHYQTLFGRDAGVALLVVMLTLKLLEMRTPRDAMLLIFLGYFLVITNFLYSQTVATGLYMLGCVWLITACMVAIHHINAPPTPRALR